MQHVSSSNVASIGYNPEDKVLVVEYHSGGVYNYYDVEQHVYESLMLASSKGGFIARNIKGRYSYDRV